MRELTRTMRVGGVLCTVELQIIEQTDRERVRQLYDSWRTLCDGMREFRSRAPNLLEGISESAFCLEFNSARVFNVQGSSGSFDTIDMDTHRRQQIKATSIENDLTSFGPTSVWDDLYFLDFYRDGQFDRRFDVYQIPDDLIYNAVLNRKKNETFRDQQQQGRRPRLGIKRTIIERNRIEPLRTCRI